MQPNYKKVISVFRLQYKPIPLEIYKNDLYKVLVSTLLSSRTRDEVTLEASLRLFKDAPNINALAKLDETKIEKLIYPVGFYKTKAKHLKKLAQIITKERKGAYPGTKSGLIALPGVGIKTANLVLNRALSTPAIAVDTHVHRISNLLGWVNTNTPEKTENELVRVLPKRYWREVNTLFVSVGRQFTSKKKLIEFLRINKLIQ